MLSFTINNEPVVLDHDTSVQLVWQNPACNFKDFPGDVGLGIDIPVNDHNRMLLGNPERFERRANENKRELPNFEIRYSGVLLMRGTLVIESAGNETYSGWLRSETGNMGKWHREKFIHDSISFHEEKSFENKIYYTPGENDYACPKIFNPVFFRDKGEFVEGIRLVENPNYNKKVWRKIGPLSWGKFTDTRQYIRAEVDSEDYTESFMLTANWRINQRDDNMLVLAPDTKSKTDPENIRDNLKVAVVSPMLYLNYVLRALFKDAGFSLRENFLEEHEDLKKLVMYHNFDITTIEYMYSLTDYYPVDMFDHLYSDPNVDMEYFYNATGVKTDMVRRYVDKFQYKELLPNEQLKDFLISIQNLLNVFFHFVPGRKIVDVIDRESILDGETIDIENYVTGLWTIDEKKDVTLKFAMEHDSNDVLVTERWEDIEEYREKEKEPVNSWDDLENITNPEMDEVRFIKQTNSYAQYRLWLLEKYDEEAGQSFQEKFIGWNQLTIGWQHGFFNYGKEEREEINTKFSTLTEPEQTGTRQKGNIRSDLFPFESFSPRLLFTDSYGNYAGYQTTNMALEWEKEEVGLMETRWKYWKRIWSTRQQVETEAHFHISALEHAVHNIYKKFRAREGEFIIEEMRTEFRMNEIGMTKIRGYKFDYAPRQWQLDEMWSIDDIIWFDEWVDMTGLEQYYPLIINW